MLETNSTSRRLLDEIRTLQVIDAHAHLMPESVQLARHKDALSVYAQYVRLPLLASGLPAATWLRIHDPEVPLRERWRLLQERLHNVRFTSFAQAAQITLEHFWGVGELTDDNLEQISERVAADNRPGLYRRVLREHCGIARVVNQDTLWNNEHDLDGYRDQELLAPVVALIDVKGAEGVEVNRLTGEDGFGSLESYLAWAGGRLERMARGGAVGFKSFAIAETALDRACAFEEYAQLSPNGGGLRLDVPSALRTWIHHELLTVASKIGLPVAVHTGFWGVTTYRPTHLLPVIERFPEIHFDLFHAGIPYAREIGTIALNYPNTSLNLCWAHSSNAALTAAALDEYLDSLGIDKIIAFGSDVHQTVEKVYGHLEVARRNLALVLGRRVDSGLLSEPEAVSVAKAWLYDNPKRIYRLVDGND